MAEQLILFDPLKTMTGEVIELPPRHWKPEWFNRERMIWALDLKEIDHTQKLLEPIWMPVRLVDVSDRHPNHPGWPGRIRKIERESESADDDSIVELEVTLEATEDEVDSWLDGMAVPTLQQVNSLAVALGVPMPYFYQPYEYPDHVMGHLCGSGGCQVVDLHDYSDWTPCPVTVEERRRQREAILGHADFGHGLRCQLGCGQEATTRLETAGGLRLVCRRCANAAIKNPPPDVSP